MLEAQETINIKRIILPETETPRLSFDPEKDIPPGRWEQIMQNLFLHVEHMKQGFDQDPPQTITRDVNYFSSCLSALKVVSPQRFSTVSIPDGYWQRVKQVLAQLDKEENGLARVNLLQEVIAIKPEMSMEFSQALEKARQDVKKFVSHQGQWGQAPAFAAVAARGLWPSNLDDLTINWDKAGHVLEMLTTVMGKSGVNSFFLEYLAGYKIVAPEKASQFIDAERIKQIKNMLKDSDIPTDYYLENARNILIINADRVEFTKHGMRLIKNRNSVQSELTPMPVVKAA